jgi:hypothetical protein
LGVFKIFLSASLVERMSAITPKNVILAGVIAVLVLYVVYQLDPSMMGLLGRRSEGFYDVSGSASAASATPAPPASASSSNALATMAQQAVSSMGSMGSMAPTSGATTEKFADLASMEGPAAFASAEAPAGCYPRDQLTPVELLPADQDTIYAQQNPMGVGSLKGKNFLSAGALIGVNTVGQSLRNANLQLRSEPPNPQVPVSIFNQATIGPDISHRPLDVGA